jgi:hypothetical protein
MKCPFLPEKNLNVAVFAQDLNVLTTEIFRQDPDPDPDPARGKGERCMEKFKFKTYHTC